MRRRAVTIDGEMLLATPGLRAEIGAWHGAVVQ